MKIIKPIINNDWDDILKEEFKKSSFQKTINLVKNERKYFKIFPQEKEVFNALKISSFKKTKIVILGQDPYHKKGLAHGLAFSVKDQINKPPSLQNIFKELKADLGTKHIRTGSLEKWGKQGVLLLNTILTVREKQPRSHAKYGWETFTDAVISKLSDGKKGIIFFLWGEYAQKKIHLIDIKKHYILKTSHPSPFSAHKGFLGSNHFSKANNFLLKNNKKTINWQL